MTESREAVRPLSVRILEKEYIVACGPDERTDLLDSAEILNKRGARDDLLGIDAELLDDDVLHFFFDGFVCHKMVY